MSTFWMAYGCLVCLPAQGCCRLRSLGAWAFCHWSPGCKKVHRFLPNLIVYLLQLSRSNHLVQPECPALVFDKLKTVVTYRHQLYCHHRWMLVHIPEWWYCWKRLLSAVLSWVCLKLGDILWHVSQYPYALRNPLHVCHLFHWNTLCDWPHLFGFLQTFTISSQTI